MTDEKEKELQELIKTGKFTDPTVFAQLTQEDKENLMNLATLNFILSESAKFRGKVIDAAIFFEAVITETLGNYFVGGNESKKNTLIKSLVFNRQNISSKISLLRKILQIEHKELYEKYKSDFADADKILIFRNNIAHSVLDTSDKFRKEMVKNPLFDGVKINYYQNAEFKTELITQKIVDNFYSDCYKLIGKFVNLQNELLKNNG